MASRAFAVFFGAALLLQVQPLIGKSLLPWYGGTPMVWTACLLFFQLALLLGYAYSHVLTERFSWRRQAAIHLVLVAASLALMAAYRFRSGSAILPAAGWKPDAAAAPTFRILATLSFSIGLPYFILSTTSPLLQHWLTLSHPAVVPYRLYALSNFGSLAALLSYPFLVEPLLSLRAQAEAWTLAYLVYLAALCACALQVARADQRGQRTAAAARDRTPRADGQPAPGRYLFSCALAAGGSLLLLALTNQICQEVAVIPFLWVLPLAIYLVTLVVCFENPGWFSRWLYFPALLLTTVLVVLVLAHGHRVSLPAQIGVYSFTLFAGCMVCHGELVRLKPAPRHLTLFYVVVAGGGALAALAVALLAPHLLTGYWELELSLLFCWILAVSRWISDRGSILYRRISAPALLSLRPSWRIAAVIGLLVALAVLLGSQAQRRGRNAVESSRNFYGTLRVEQAVDPAGRRSYLLFHGSTVHGYQFADGPQRGRPTSYYGPNSGIGMALRRHPGRAGGGRLSIGVIGLGVGTIAAYGQPGDQIRFYEINPDVIRLAQGAGGYFDYLAGSRACVEVIAGDGRIALEQQLGDGGSLQLDVLAVDAFASGAIPVHLLTKEALEIYLRHLRPPHGVLVFNITNEYLDLRPVLRTAAEHFGLAAAWVQSPAQGEGLWPSTWMLLTRPGATSRQYALGDSGRQVPLWTDDYSNLFGVLK